MNLHLDRRCFIRLIIFALAVPAVLITYLCMNYTRAVSAENALESSYLKNISNLSAYLENLDNALTKTIYCGTSAAFGEMTATVWREAGFAKDALASLPQHAMPNAEEAAGRVLSLPIHPYLSQQEVDRICE